MHENLLELLVLRERLYRSGIRGECLKMIEDVLAGFGL